MHGVSEAGRQEVGEDGSSRIRVVVGRGILWMGVNGLLGARVELHHRKDRVVGRRRVGSALKLCNVGGGTG
jgi:hypothetical protein